MNRFALLVALLGVGCAAPRQYFRPADGQHGQTMQGYPEVMYPLVGPKGQFGEAKLWSRGSYHSRHGETLLHVAMELHNTSGAPLTLSTAEVRLESVETERGPLGDIPTRAAADRTIGPGSIGETGFEFLLPAPLAPGEITGFVVRWSVHEGGQSYSQRTPFVVEYRPRYYATPYGYPYGYSYYPCEALDPLCRYGYGYGYYGAPLGPPYYHPNAFVPGPAGGGVIVRPRR